MKSIKSLLATIHEGAPVHGAPLLKESFQNQLISKMGNETLREIASLNLTINSINGEMLICVDDDYPVSSLVRLSGGYKHSSSGAKFATREECMADFKRRAKKELSERGLKENVKDYKQSGKTLVESYSLQGSGNVRVYPKEYHGKTGFLVSNGQAKIFTTSKEKADRIAAILKTEPFGMERSMKIDKILLEAAQQVEPDTTTKGKTFTNATMYRQGGLGAFVRTDCKWIRLSTRKWAQYDRALRVEWLEVGKRKPVAFIFSYKPTIIVVPTNKAIDPQDPWTNRETKGGVEVSRSKYQSTDDRWSSDFEGALKAQHVPILFHYKDVNTLPHISEETVTKILTQVHEGVALSSGTHPMMSPGVVTSIPNHREVKSQAVNVGDDIYDSVGRGQYRLYGRVVDTTVGSTSVTMYFKTSDGKTSMWKQYRDTMINVGRRPNITEAIYGNDAIQITWKDRNGREHSENPCTSRAQAKRVVASLLDKKDLDSITSVDVPSDMQESRKLSESGATEVRIIRVQHSRPWCVVLASTTSPTIFDALMIRRKIDPTKDDAALKMGWTGEVRFFSTKRDAKEAADAAGLKVIV